MLELVDMATWEEVDGGMGLDVVEGFRVLRLMDGDMKVDEQKNVGFLSNEEWRDFLSLCMGQHGKLWRSDLTLSVT